MKKLLSIAILLPLTGYSQVWQGKVVDGETNASLAYVSITYQQNSIHSFSDTNGIFYINKSLVNANDSINFSYVGFKKLSLPVSQIFSKNMIRLERIVKDLDIIEINTLKIKKTHTVKTYRKIDLHYSVSPGVKKHVDIGVYKFPGTTGFLKELSFYVAHTPKNFNTPIQLRWYQWDSANHTISHELSDTNIFIFPRHKGWNTVTLPNKLIAADEYIALGIEFIYPAQLQKDYWDVQNSGDSVNMAKWDYENITWWIGANNKAESYYEISPGKYVKAQHANNAAFKFSIVRYY